jgi:hypothetical protein
MLLRSTKKPSMLIAQSGAAKAQWPAPPAVKQRKV